MTLNAQGNKPPTYCGGPGDELLRQEIQMTGSNA